MPPPPKEFPRIPFWPFLFKNLALKRSPKIKTDWDRYQDEDQEKDELDNFDPEKLVSLMKKNGELDEGDEEMYG